MRLLKEYYTYHNIITQYLVVREQKPPRKHHYHVVILFDGSKVENGWEVLKKADGIWQRRVGSDVESCVHLCRRSDGSNGIMIVRPKINAVGLDLQNQLAEFNVAYSEAMTWLDYLAKTATKGHAPSKTKEWFSSHLWI
jgi:hypothetical protein